MTPALEAKLDCLCDHAAVFDAHAHHSTADLLQTLRGTRDTAESALYNAVAMARSEGMTWDEIARWIGGTRQNAQQRYGSFGDSTA